MTLVPFNIYKEESMKFINERQSFIICEVEITNIFEVSGWLEEYIEKKYLTCRVLTKNRLAAGLSYAIDKRLGLLSLAFIMAHNFMTRNPHYEIIRDLANGRVEVVYKK